MVGSHHLAQEGEAEIAEDAADVRVVLVEPEQRLGEARVLRKRERLEQRLLRVEIDIERALRHAGPAGYLAHGGAVEARGQEHVAGAGQDLPPLGTVAHLVRQTPLRHVDAHSR